MLKATVEADSGYAARIAALERLVDNPADGIAAHALKLQEVQADISHPTTGLHAA